MLPEKHPEGYDPIIWLNWFQDEDYACVYYGGYCFENKIKKKRLTAEKHKENFDFITVKTYPELFDCNPTLLFDGLNTDDLPIPKCDDDN